MEKVCRICGESKPLDRFSKRPKSRANDGYRNDCKACVVARTSGRDRSEYSRQWRADNAERIQRYRTEHPRDDRAGYFRQYRADNPDRIRAIVGKSIRKNKASRTARGHERRAVPMDDTAREYVALLLRDLCSYCPSPAVTIDHIVPLSRGGTNDWWNLTGACKSCNSSKGTRHLLQHLLLSA